MCVDPVRAQFLVFVKNLLKRRVHQRLEAGPCKGRKGCVVFPWCNMALKASNPQMWYVQHVQHYQPISWYNLNLSHRPFFLGMISRRHKISACHSQPNVGSFPPRERFGPHLEPSSAAMRSGFVKRSINSCGQKTNHLDACSQRMVTRPTWTPVDVTMNINKSSPKNVIQPQLPGGSQRVWCHI